MLLTLKTIRRKLRQGSLPSRYEIKPPLHLTKNMFMRTLSLFEDNNQMLFFIGALSTHKTTHISFGNNRVALGGMERLIHVYTSDSLYPPALNESKQQVILKYFKRFHFDQKQLSYILNNFQDNVIRELILGANCFDREDLVRLCKIDHTLENKSLNLLKLLYHYLNPVREWMATQTPLLDMHYFAYRAGHISAVTNNITFQHRDKTYHFQTSGDYNENSLKILAHKLDMYRQSNPSPIYDTIYKAIKDCHSQLKLSSNTYNKEASSFFYHKYLQNNLTYISSGWLGHTVGVALYGPYLVYCNRGQYGDQAYGCKLYKITRPEKVNAHFFSLLTSTGITYRSHISVIGSIVNLKRPLIKFRCKAQKRADCTFSNPKAIVEALIVLTQVPHNASVWTVRSIGRQEQYRTKYKHFTYFVKKTEIDELVKNMFYARGDLLVAFYANLVKSIITEHHGGQFITDKSKLEVMRAYELYYRCPDHIKNIIKEDTEFMDLIKDIKQRKDFIIVQQTRHPLKQKSHTLLFSYKGTEHKATLKKGFIKMIDGKEAPKMPFSYRQARNLCLKI